MPFTYDTFKQMIDDAHIEGARDIWAARWRSDKVTVANGLCRPLTREEKAACATAAEKLQRQLQQFDDAWALTAHMKVRVRNGPMLTAGLIAWVGLAVLVGVLVLGIGRLL